MYEELPLSDIRDNKILLLEKIISYINPENMKKFNINRKMY